MRTTKQIGDIAEAKVLARLLQLGRVVLQPFGDNQRYDLVIDTGGTFQRVQVKSARLREGAVLIPMTSMKGRYARERRGYYGEVELIAAYCEETDRVYMVPVEQAARVQVSLRVAPVKNGQQKAIRWAVNYEL